MNKLFHIFFGLSNNSNKINKGIVNNYNKFLFFNGDFQIMKWNSTKSLEILEKYFPEYVSVYRNTKDYRYKCDLVRLVVLYVYGGLYMDIDAECLTSIKSMDINEDSILSVVFNDNEKEIFNSLIYVKEKNNNFIKICIDEYTRTLQSKNIGACPIMKSVFDNEFKDKDYKKEGIIIHYEKPTKKLEECNSKEEFWNSFYIFNSSGEKIFKSRYDGYYVDRRKIPDVDFL